MTGLKFQQMPMEQVKEDVERHFAHTDHLMIVIVDFKDGPKEEPDPPHSHPHEQVTYVAEGEIAFFIDGNETRLCPGDVFLVPSGKMHTIQLLSAQARLIDCFTPIREDFIK
jgi:quercetin dioxygenase-like cupin family protein